MQNSARPFARQLVGEGALALRGEDILPAVEIVAVVVAVGLLLRKVFAIHWQIQQFLRAIALVQSNKKMLAAHHFRAYWCNLPIRLHNG